MIVRIGFELLAAKNERRLALSIPDFSDSLE